tara:strand:+ start:302 stop:985 length:684 start_codon:yes stop_codon:yes gene_type:complete
MINENRWIKSLPDSESNKEVKDQIDPNIWTNTISKKNSYSSISKYSFVAALFIIGLVFVSVVKNETRNLQKEINILHASINSIKFNLDKAVIDNEVLTSPENISYLAKEYLNDYFRPYKKSQIHRESDKFIKTSLKNKTNKSLQTKVAQALEKKKLEIAKLKKIYSNTESVPQEIKAHVAIKIEQKKKEIKNIYSEPEKIFTSGKAQRWAAIQVVKAFFGIPIIPGK